MALSSKPKTHPLVRGVALVGTIALGACSDAHSPADGGMDAGPGDGGMVMEDGAVTDTSVVNDGGFPDDLGVDDVGIPPMPPPADGGGGLDGGISPRDGGGAFDGGLPPMPPPRDGGPPPRIDSGMPAESK